ncbi:MAG: hypothetical protein U1E65_26545 [Myxococcota bacterium]
MSGAHGGGYKSAARPMSQRYRRLAAGLVLAMIGHPALARPSYQLRVEPEPAIEGCPSPEVLEAAVSARLGYRPWDPEATRRIRLWIQRSGQGIVGRLEIEAKGAVGIKELGPVQDCGALTDPAAFAIALAIDPLGGAAVQPAPPIQTSTRPVALPAIRAVPSSTQARAAQPALRAAGPAVLTRLGLVLGAGAAPAISVGFDLGASLRFSRWAIGLEGRFDLPAGISAGGGGRVHSALYLLTLAPCLGGQARWEACALVSGGAILVSGEDLVRPANGSGAYVAIGARLGVLWPLAEGFGLAAGVEARAVLTRIALGDAEGTITYWTTPLANGSLVLSGTYEID